MKTKTINKEKKLFDLLESVGEQLEGKIHIIDNTEYPTYSRDECAFRVYHADGYCFDCGKEYVCEPDEVDEYDEYRGTLDKNGFSYWFSSEWDGFKELNTVEKAIELIKKIRK